MGLNEGDGVPLKMADLADLAEDVDPIVPEADEPDVPLDELADTPEKKSFLRDMMNGNLTPPAGIGKQRASKRIKVSSSGPKITPAKPRPGALKAPLMKMYATIGMTTMAFDPVCGQAIIANAEQCAEAVEELARQNEAVRRIVYQLITTSAWGAVIGAHLPLLFTIAVHHIPAMQQSEAARNVQTMMAQSPQPEDTAA